MSDQPHDQLFSIRQIVSFIAIFAAVFLALLSAGGVAYVVQRPRTPHKSDAKDDQPQSDDFDLGAEAGHSGRVPAMANPFKSDERAADWQRGWLSESKPRRHDDRHDNGRGATIGAEKPESK